MNPHRPSKQHDAGRPGNDARPAKATPAPDLQPDDAGTAASGNDPATPGEPLLEPAGKAPSSRDSKLPKASDTQDTH